MRPLRLLIAVIFLAAGVVLGALNAQPVTVDLGMVRVDMPLGIAMLAAVLVGVLAGGLALTASVVLPMQRRLRRERGIAATSAEAAKPPAATGER